MNKNIKFFNFNEDPTIKISGKHAFTGENNSNKFKNQDNPIQIVLDNYMEYAIADVDTFETVIKRLYTKMLNKYLGKSLNKEFIIMLSTLEESKEQAKIDLDVLQLSFTSTKTIFIDSNQFNMDLTGIEITDNENKCILNGRLNINCIAFSKNSYKDILEFIVLLSYYPHDNVLKVSVKVRKHTGIKSNLNIVNPNIFDFSFEYVNAKCNKQNKIDYSFNFIYKIIENITKFLNYTKRDQNEKETFMNLDKNVLISNIDKIKFTETILTYNKQLDYYLKDTLESVRDPNKANEILKTRYYDSLPLLNEHNKLALTFELTNDKYKINFEDLDQDQMFLIMHPYGIVRTPHYLSTPSKEEEIRAIVVNKQALILKYNSYLNQPSVYNIMISVDIKNKVILLELQTTINEMDLIFNKNYSKQSKLILKNFNFSRYIHPFIYFPEKTIETDEIVRYEPPEMTLSEIEKIITDISADNIIEDEDDDDLEIDPDKNNNNTLEHLADVVFNETILKKLICDAIYLADKWKH